MVTRLIGIGGQQADYYRQNRSEMLTHIPDDVHTLLEIGCGDGSFLEAFCSSRQDVRAYGVEANWDAAARARSRGLAVSTGRFPNVVPQDTKFDCVLFNDVLEHIEDPWGAINAASAVLVPGGCVVACIPNIRNVDVVHEIVVEGNFQYQTAGVLDVTHLRFFTMMSARQLFEDCEYRVDNIVGLRRRRPRRRYLPFFVLNSLFSSGFRREALYRQFVVLARSHVDK